jgi:hypothetical protein
MRFLGFFVFTEGVGFESDSWAVQCEILQSNMLGVAPQDEDFSPGDDDFNPNQFIYHGFGQMGQGPPPHLLQNHKLSPIQNY